MNNGWKELKLIEEGNYYINLGKNPLNEAEVVFFLMERIWKWELVASKLDKPIEDIPTGTFFFKLLNRLIDSILVLCVQSFPLKCFDVNFQEPLVKMLFLVFWFWILSPKLILLIEQASISLTDLSYKQDIFCQFISLRSRLKNTWKRFQ